MEPGTCGLRSVNHPACRMSAARNLPSSGGRGSQDLQEQLYIDTRDWSPLPLTDPERLRREFPDYHVAVSGELVTLSRFPIVLERPVDLRPWLARPWPDLPPADSQMPAYHTVKTLRTDLLVAGRVVSFYLQADPALLRARLHKRAARFDANAAFPINDGLLTRYLESFEPPSGEGEEVVVVSDG
ncbi:hypothetical protein ABGB16_25880 [Micromonospora sp. B11E3]|uniref:hypothetical protein n=1 Tax=Micromonospora sp. B11E3 TaxID=3153562 RepID=UPI00325E07AB